MSKGMKIVLGVTAGVLLILVLSISSCYGYINGVRGDAKAKENGLSTEYLDCQNYLSSYISGFYEKVGIFQTQSDKVNQILTDAVKGRYNSQVGGEEVHSGPFDQKAFFSAIAEAYPDGSLQSLNQSADKISEYISSGREGYRNKQSKLLDELRTYDNWLTTDIARQFALNFLSFPSDSLVARIGDQKWTGKDAEDKMYQIVLASEAKQAYQTGTMNPLTVPKQ